MRGGQAHTNLPIGQARREVELGESFGREKTMHDGASTERVEYVPPQIDARVDAMQRLLVDTDWNPAIKQAFLFFAQRAVYSSPIIRSEKAQGVLKLEQHLEEASELITDEVERRVLAHLQQAMASVKDLMHLEMPPPDTWTSDRQEAIANAQQTLESARRASQVVDKESRRKILQLLCSLLETELELVEALEESSDSATGLSED